MTFDEVLGTLFRICVGSSAATGVAKWTVVRDLRGRVRLVVEPAPGRDVTAELLALEDSLKEQLGRYFAPPTLSTADTEQARRRLASEVANQLRREPLAQEFRDPVTGQPVEPKGDWYLIERRISKADWLERGNPQPPWPLVEARPAIATFYSFKGGVGRSTALASCAWQLARKGHTITVVDLDLEAPGLGSLLGADTQRGVLDLIVDHMATGSVDLTGAFGDAKALGSDAERVRVFPAGRLNMAYLDKLARLDFAGDALDATGAPASSVAQALKSLLDSMANQQPSPRMILLDSRAGLHDMGGLSLHGLAHVDVLLSRATEQAYQGLTIALATLSRRRGKELNCINVHALAPSSGTPEAEQEEREYRTRTYELFVEHVYSGFEDSQIPAVDSSGDPHSPFPLRHSPELMRFRSLSDRGEVLFGEDYSKLVARLLELCEPEDDDPGEASTGAVL